MSALIFYIMYVVLHVLECEIQPLFDWHEKGLSTFNYFWFYECEIVFWYRIENVEPSN